MLNELNEFLYGVDDMSLEMIFNYIEMYPDDLNSFSESIDYFCAYCGLSV